MSDKASPRIIRKALSEAVWGYFFLTFDFNFFAVSLLPEFVGWILLLSAVRGLEEERRDLKLLRPFAHVMIVLRAFDYLGSFWGLSLSGQFLPLSLLPAAAGLYFHFLFLTACAAIAGEHAAPVVGRRLLFWRTAMAVTQTAIALFVYFRPSLGEWGGTAEVILAAAGILAVLCVMAALHTLRRFFPA